jgi:hypothetical protein
MGVAATLTSPITQEALEWCTDQLSTNEPSTTTSEFTIRPATVLENVASATRRQWWRKVTFSLRVRTATTPSLSASWAWSKTTRTRWTIGYQSLKRSRSSKAAALSRTQTLSFRTSFNAVSTGLKTPWAPWCGLLKCSKRTTCPTPTSRKLRTTSTCEVSDEITTR